MFVFIKIKIYEIILKFSFFFFKKGSNPYLFNIINRNNIYMKQAKYNKHKLKKFKPSFRPEKQKENLT